MIRASNIMKKRFAHEYAGRPCTLNGKAARVTGRLNAFATVAQIPEGESAEFSWITVDRVMQYKDGTFRC